MPIANVTLSNTFDEWRIRHNVITVNVNALQNTATGLNYTVANNVHAFLNIRSADGSESSPAITNFGDMSTGIRFPSNGQFAVSVNGVDAMSVDNTRNITFSNTVTFKTANFADDVTFNGGIVTFNTGSTFNANVTFSSTNVTVNANTDFEGLVRLKNTVTLSSHVIPSVDATYDIGTAANSVGSLYANNVQTNNFNINNSGNTITSIEHDSNLAGGDTSIPTSRATSEYADNQSIAFAIALG